MKLFRLSQSKNNDYDTYDSCVVAAESAEVARVMHPGGEPDDWTEDHWMIQSWTDPSNVTVEEIGEAKDGLSGVILASFNAG